MNVLAPLARAPAPVPSINTLPILNALNGSYYPKSVIPILPIRHEQMLAPVAHLR